MSKELIERLREVGWSDKDIIERLEAEKDQLENKIDKLEWENKGIAEWRSAALDYQRLAGNYETELAALKAQSEPVTWRYKGSDGLWYKTIPIDVAVIEAQPLYTAPPSSAETKCRCDVRTKVLGDGCEVCNPEYSAEHSQSAEDAEDAARLSFIESLFERKWNGVVGSGSKSTWHIKGDYRHRIANMHGETFGEAIDAARGEG
jgi:hypothetical protein